MILSVQEESKPRLERRPALSYSVPCSSVWTLDLEIDGRRQEAKSRSIFGLRRQQSCWCDQQALDSRMWWVTGAACRAFQVTLAPALASGTAAQHHTRPDTASRNGEASPTCARIKQSMMHGSLAEHATLPCQLLILMHQERTVN